ncbi:phosphoglycerate mutase family protein [Jeotgalibacillus sp. ET6]|uniref:phosphoglycerate mutase family protein n=1 Tax=Jeotgalibacillus sp. ET6 TaxID=3037260 RepID=UPI00241873CB|nr:histidine phosphatase family protein [Jeotgalibacillus sp. ET6]MDG5472019.1 phosphoglycerate mutase family protein [Jeotgalibacillus sp. ET6]
MNIYLIRHGKSTHTGSKRMTQQELRDWFEQYNQAGVREEERYPPSTVKQISLAKAVLTSDLNRAIESAGFLQTEILLSDSLFREVDIPHLPKAFDTIRLKAHIWSIILRSLWFLGYSRECESLKEATNRAEEAAQMLIDHAQKCGTVALIGHGIFNRLIAKKLQAAGWKGKTRSSLRHWRCSTYSKR